MPKNLDPGLLFDECTRIANGVDVAFNLIFATVRARRLKQASLTSLQRDELLRLLVLGRRNIVAALADFPRHRVERGVDAVAALICLAAESERKRAPIEIDHQAKWLGLVADAADIDDRLEEFAHRRRARIIASLRDKAA